MKIVKYILTSFLGLLCLPLLAQNQTNITGIAINLEGNIMYYTAVSGGEHKLYKATKTESGVWTAGSPENEFNMHTEGYIIKTPFLSYDGQTMYISANLPGSKGFDIYFSKKNGSKWGKPEPVPVINTESDEMSPSLSADNSTIYFTRSNQDGCYNVYAAKYDISGWAMPKILPAPITVGCENYATISPLGDFILFSSDRPSERRRKKYNAYYAVCIADNVWSPPVPTEEMLKEYDEYSPVFDSRNNEIYVSRGELGNEHAIFSMHSYTAPAQIINKPYSIVKGIVKNESDKPLSVTITIRNAYSNSVYSRINSDPATGEYIALLPNNGLYILNFYERRGSETFENINTENNIQAQVINKNIVLSENIKVNLEIQDALSNALIDADVKAYDKTRRAKVTNISKGIYEVTAPLLDGVEIEVYKDNYIKENINVNIGEYMKFPEMYYSLKLKPDLRSGQINVKDIVTSKGLNAKVEIKNLDINNDNVFISTPDTGTYKFNIRKENHYSISVTLKDHLYFYTIWSADASRISQVLDVRPVPLSEVNKIPMPYLTFNTNESSFLPEAEGELYCVTQVLKNNPEYTAVITLYHLDNEKELTLVQERAKAITIFLSSNFIPSYGYKIEYVKTDKVKNPDIHFVLR